MKHLRNVWQSAKKSMREVRFKQLYKKYSDYTMMSQSSFIKTLRLCDDFRHIDGSVIECGVWRGGMIAAISEHLGNSRSYYLFDSFEGLPEARSIDGLAALEWQRNKTGPTYHNNCTAEISFAENAMRISGSDKHEIIKGWFSETLTSIPLSVEIAILRLDADWYDSTIQCLERLYPKVKKGGVVIIDDYYVWDGCSRAVHDYLSKNQLPDRIHHLDEGSCYILKR